MKYLRSVKVFTWESGAMVFESDAVLHGFSTNWEELRDGIGQYPVAIVEFPDGSLGDKPLHLVRFNQPTQPDF